MTTSLSLVKYFPLQVIHIHPRFLEIINSILFFTYILENLDEENQDDMCTEATKQGANPDEVRKEDTKQGAVTNIDKQPEKVIESKPQPEASQPEAGIDLPWITDLEKPEMKVIKLFYSPFINLQ